MTADPGVPGTPPDAGGPAGHSRLLRSNRTFRSFWLARTVSHLGDGAALTALILFVQETERNGLAVGGFLLAQALPRLLSPLAGSLADRMDQRRLMISCDAIQAVLFTVVAATLPTFPVLVAVGAVASTLDTLFGPAGSSAVPMLVGSANLAPANAWIGTSLNIQVVLGPVLGGALTALAGPRGALALDAASFLVSIMFLRSIPRLPPEPLERGGRAGIFRSTWVGVVEGLRNRVVRAVFVGLLLGVGVAAMDNVALVFLAKQRGAGDVGYGFLVSAFGVGMIVASLTLVRVGRRLRPVGLLLLGWTLVGAGALLTAALSLVGGMLVGMAFAGAGNGSTNVADSTLVQQHVPRRLLGRAFGLTRTGAFLGQAIAAVLAGWLLELTSPAAVFVVSGCGSLMIVALLWALLRGSLPGSPSEDPRSVRRPPATAAS